MKKLKFPFAFTLLFAFSYLIAANHLDVNTLNIPSIVKNLLPKVNNKSNKQGRAAGLMVANCAVNAGVPETFCQDQIRLDGNTSAINIDLNSILWTVVSQPAGANVSIVTPSSASSLVTGTIVPGSYTFQIQATCQDGDTPTQQVTHTVVASPSLPTASTTFSGCYTGGGMAFTGSAPPAGGTVTWEVVGGMGGNISASGSQNMVFTPSISKYTCYPSGNYTTTLRYTVTNSGGCSRFRDVIVNYKYAADALYAEAVPRDPCILCTDLFAACQLDGIGTWTYTGPGTATFSSGVNASNTRVCVSVAGTYTFTWTVTGSSCRNGSDDDTVTFTDFGYPEDVDAGPSQKYCDMPSSISLNASSLGTGQIGTWRQINGVPVTITDDNDPSTTVTGLVEGGGPYWFAWEVRGASESGGCPVVDTVTVAEIPDLVWSSTTFPTCNSSSAASFNPWWTSNIIPWSGFDTIAIKLTVLEAPIQDIRNFRVKTVHYRPGLPSFTAACYQQVANPTATFTGNDEISGTNSAGMFCDNPIIDNDTYQVQFFVEHWPLYFYPGRYVIQMEVWNGCDTYTETKIFDYGRNFGTPNAGTDINLSCGTTTYQLAGNTTSGSDVNRFNWSMISGPGSSPINSTNYMNPTPTLSALLDGTYIFRYSEITGQSTCPGEYDDVTVIVNTRAPAGVTASLVNSPVCGTANMVGTLGDNGALGTWSLVSSSPTDADGVIFSPNANALNVDVSDLEVNTTYNFQWSVSNNCGATTAPVSFTTTGNIGPDPAIITTPEPLCIASPTTTSNLAATAIVNGTGTWSVLSQPAGASTTFGTPNSNTTTVSGLTMDGQYTILWSVTNPPCATVSTDTIKIGRGSPSTPDAGVNVIDCSVEIFPHTETLAANTITIGSAYWRFFSGPSNVTFSNINSPTSTVTFSAPGTYVLEWVASVAGCNTVVDAVTYKIGGTPAAHAGLDQQRCGGSATFTLDALDIPSGEGSGLWTVQSITSGSSISFANATNPNTTVTLSNGAVVELKWTTYPPAGDACPAKSDIVVLNWTAPAMAGADQDWCEANSISLTGNVPETGNTVTWSKISGPAATINSPNSSITTVTGLTAGTYVFRYTKTTSTCGTLTDDVTVNIHTLVTPNAGIRDTICASAGVIQLAGSTPPGGTTGTWSLVYKSAGTPAGSFSNVNTPNATYSPIHTDVATYIFRWTYDDGFCEKFDDVRIDLEFCCPTILDTILVCTGTTAPSSYDLTDALGGSSWSFLYQPSGASASISATTGVISNMSVAGDYVAVLSGGSCLDTVHVVLPACNLPCVCYDTSTEGYADFSALGTSIISGPVSNSFNFSIPGHGTGVASYTITAGGRIRQEPTTFTSLDAIAYDALGYAAAPWPVQPLYLETFAGATQTVNFVFTNPVGDFDFIIYDVDENDDVTITATDADGNTITDFSSWIVRGMGDASTGVASGQPAGTIAPPPVYAPSTGHLTSATLGINQNRGFIAIRPDELIKSIQITLNSSVTGNHVYLGMYGTLSGDSSPCCPNAPAVYTTVNTTGCYDDNGNASGGSSKALVQVIVDWENEPTGELINVTVSGAASQSVNPATATKPAILYFVVDAGSTGTVDANFSTTSAPATQKNYDTGSVTACLLTPCLSASNGGMVWRDFDNDGIKDANETVGIGGVTVTAYWDNGTTSGVATTVTDYLGQYNINSGAGINQIPIGAKVRLEFTNLPTGLEPTASGSDNGTAVQFYTAPSCGRDFAVNYPNDYCQEDPTMMTPFYMNGSAEANKKALVGFAYSLSGNPSSGVNIEVNADVIGATWGLAYDNAKKDLYAAAFLKRHVGLKDNNADGKGDLGAIYVKDLATNTTSLWLDLTSLGIDVGMSLLPTDAVRNLPADFSQPSRDAAVYDLIGKIGLGDIDISEDFSTLYAVNLFDKSVYAFDIASKTLKAGFPVPIPNECNAGTGALRPFALKYNRGNIYVGAVCDAQISNDSTDLQANVYRLDGASFTNVLSFPLDYDKGCAWVGSAPGGQDCNHITGWYPWTANNPLSCDGANFMYPQPILSDIEFDATGAMILAFMDRLGHQTGKFNLLPDGSSTLGNGIIGGDILRAAQSGSMYVIENNATSGGLTTAGANNGEGLGGGEFFYGDRFFNGYVVQHCETSFGALAIKYGSGEIAMTSMDPVDNNTTYKNAGGIVYLNTMTGAKEDGVLLYRDWDPGTFTKANGLGDIELICNQQPLEIGNYVWVDADADGIQDPAETPIAGVQVRLYDDAGALIGLTTTNSLGEYYFNTANVDTTGVNATTGAALTSFTGLSYFAQYYIVVGQNGQFNTTSDLLTVGGVAYALTTSNTGEGSAPDENDSDATLASGVLAAVNGYPYISLTTEGAGSSNHTYDFGFREGCVLNYANLTVGTCNNNSTTTNPNDDTFTFTLNPSGSATGTNYQVLNGATVLGTGTYGTPLTLGPYNISAGALSITIRDVDDTSCVLNLTVNPPFSCSNCPAGNCLGARVVPKTN